MRHAMVMAMVLMACAYGLAADAPYRELAKKNDFFGYDRYEFRLDGLACYVIEPKSVAEAKPWIWRARFDSKAFPAFDRAMLAEGHHVAKVNVGGLFGSPKAMAVFDTFYAYCTETLRFSRKPTLEGLSRGGLPIFNWAIRNPGKVSCVYADAAVCDIKSWPGGKGKGKHWAPGWEKCLELYGISEETAVVWEGNPVDNVQVLAKAQVPVICVVGDADPVVPSEENTLVMEKCYNEAIPEGGMKLKVIHKPGVGHHPHGLKDPTPLVEFVKTATGLSPDGAE